MAHPVPLIPLEDCDTFLKTHLEFGNWKEILEKDKTQFLKLFVEKHVTNIYYQNVHLAGRPESEWRFPTEEEVIENGLNGRGGICFELNHFARVLLASIGFEVWAVHAHCIGIYDVDVNHYGIICRVGEKLFFVDMGQLHPHFEPVDLDTEVDPNGNHEIIKSKDDVDKLLLRNVVQGYPYEYRKCEKVPGSDNPLELTDHFARYHFKGRVTLGDFNDGKTVEKFTTFNLEPKPYEFFNPSMTKLLKGEDERGVFHRNLILTRFINDHKSGKRIYVLIIGSKLIIGDKDSRTTKEFGGYDDPEFRECLKEYFPKLQKEDLDKAFETYTKFCSSRP